MSDRPAAYASLQTPPGRGGIAVIVLSGPGTEQTVSQVFQPLRSHAGAGSDSLRLGHIVSDGQVIDEAIVSMRPAAAEINIHGGPTSARKVMQLLSQAVQLHTQNKDILSAMV